MIEEPEKAFPPSEKPENDDLDDEESSLSEQTAVCVKIDEAPTDSQPHPSSSTASEGDSTGPPTAPQSPPAVPRGGRASIPDELEPDQLARLTDLKESNA